MGKKMSCWEFKKCGREPGGVSVDKLGGCPAAEDASFNGLNGGKNGGRICWAVSGTLCENRIEGLFAKKYLSCIDCDFFNKVWEEEKNDLKLLKSDERYEE